MIFFHVWVLKIFAPNISVDRILIFLYIFPQKTKLIVTQMEVNTGTEVGK